MKPELYIRYILTSYACSQSTCLATMISSTLLLGLVPTTSPVGKPGSLLQKFEKATWSELDRICRHVAEAGIHFQETKVFGRKKDVGTATGQWLEELTKEDAWFRNIVPNVCDCFANP